MSSGLNEWIRIGAPAAGAAGIATAAAAYVTFAPRSTFWGPVVIRGTTHDPPRVALTFDDGPHPSATPRILDILSELRARASFFVIGRFVQQHPQLVLRMHREGHVVANHSHDHEWGLLRGRAYWRRQLDRTDAAIQRAIGLRPRLFRPPLGVKTWPGVRAATVRHTVVMWTRRGMDGVATTSDRILGRLADRAKAGEILVLHDGVSPQSRRDPGVTVQALRPLVLALRAHGLEPVRLDELTGLEPFQKCDGA